MNTTIPAGTLLTEIKENTEYVSWDKSVTLRREDGLTPNGNKIGQHWVLRHNEQWVDYGQFRYDLADQYGLKLQGAAGEIYDMGDFAAPN